MATRIKVELQSSPNLLKRRFAELKTGRDVANLLEVPYSYLIQILYWGRWRHPYRVFSIAKRSGGVREISAPPASLRILQAKLNSILQLVYVRKPAVHGFVSGKSILSNAQGHVGKRFVLNVDLADFFPSINFGRVRGVFMARPYSIPAPAATVLAHMCCHEQRLPQGAPSSPIVSNLVCAKLDGELQALAKKHRCMYTRYADDITFSTTVPNFPRELARPLTSLSGDGLVLGQALIDTIESNGFEINTKKQRLQIAGMHQEVTGLTVNRFPNVARPLVRQIRAMLHAWEKYGLPAAEKVHNEKFGKPSGRPGGQAAAFSSVVRGKLAFLAMVKGPHDQTYRRFRNQLNVLDPSLIERVED